MKKWIPLLVLLLVCFVNRSSAGHVAGAEVTYKATATPGIIEVHLVVYRTCDGGITLCANSCAAACTQTMMIDGADPSCTSSNFGSLVVSLVNVRDIKNNQSETVKNTCTNMNCATPGTFTPGIERYEFVGVANIGTSSGIPASCCNVRFSWTHSSRSMEIVTGSAYQNIYIDAIVNRCQYNLQSIPALHILMIR
ncbi:MAG: hypothetical protein V4590_09785 [Bacteroidota bacterium]